MVCWRNSFLFWCKAIPCVTKNADFRTQTERTNSTNDENLDDVNVINDLAKLNYLNNFIKKDLANALLSWDNWHSFSHAQQYYWWAHFPCDRVMLVFLSSTKLGYEPSRSGLKKSLFLLLFWKVGLLWLLLGSII